MASVCPVATFWPVVTSTAVTVPDTAKVRSESSAGARVPDAETVWFMVPIETFTFSLVTVTGDAVLDEPPLRVAAQMPVPPPPSTQTAATTAARRPRVSRLFRATST